MLEGRVRKKMQPSRPQQAERAKGESIYVADKHLTKGGNLAVSNALKNQIDRVSNQEYIQQWVAWIERTRR